MPANTFIPPCKSFHSRENLLEELEFPCERGEKKRRRRRKLNLLALSKPKVMVSTSTYIFLFPNIFNTYLDTSLGISQEKDEKEKKFAKLVT